jgi:hypothetical protein
MLLLHSHTSRVLAELQFPGSGLAAILNPAEGRNWLGDLASSKAGAKFSLGRFVKFRVEVEVMLKTLVMFTVRVIVPSGMDGRDERGISTDCRSLHSSHRATQGFQGFIVRILRYALVLQG